MLRPSPTLARKDFGSNDGRRRLEVGEGGIPIGRVVELFRKEAESSLAVVDDLTPRLHPNCDPLLLVLKQNAPRTILLGHLAGYNLVYVRRRGPEYPFRRNGAKPFVVGNGEGITFYLRCRLGVDFHVRPL
jgi:hypothetical protein